MKKHYLCFMCIILVFMCSFVQAATVKNFKNVTEQAGSVVVVKKGTIIEYTKTDAKLSVNNPQIAIVEGQKIKIADSGRFKVTIIINGQSQTQDFFAWNAYLKSGKFWTYKDAKKASKSNILYARTYLDLSEANSKVFKVDDYVLKTGTYTGELKGKFLTSYYDKAKDKSTSKYYEYAMKSKFEPAKEPEVITPVVPIPSVNEPEVITPVVPAPPVNEPEVITPVVPAPPVNEPEVITPVVPAPPVNEPEVITPVVPAPPVNEPEVITPTQPTISDKMEIHYINPNSRVDAIYIKVGDTSMFIDGGFYRDAKAEIKYLKKIGVTHIDYYIGSHAHSNHVGAAGPIIKEFGIDKILVGPATYNGKNSAIYMMNNKATTKAEKNAIAACKVKVLNPGTKFEINGLKIQCLGPIKLTKTAPGNTAENKNSIILRMDFGNVSILTAGDTGKTQLKEANKKYPGMLDVDIYKNSHHNGAMSEDVIKLISPKYVVFTTMDGYLPSSSYLKLLKKHNAKYYMATNKKDGNIVITTDGNSINVKTKN